MKSQVFGFALLSVTAIVASAPAQATGTLTRTFVSSAGIDSNPCTVAEPCATFVAAYAAVAADGIVAALDPGKYGPLTITGPVTINGNGWAAITAPAGGDGIDINAVSGKVTLRGLEIDGAATGGDGIVFNSGASLNVQDCLIRDFGAVTKSRGIVFQPTAASSLFVSDTVLADNKGPGIALHPTASSGTYTGVLEHVTIDGSGAVGIAVAGVNLSGTATLAVNVGDSVIANSVTNGIDVRTTTAAVFVMVRGTTIANSGGTGVLSVGSTSTVEISHSVITGNATGWAIQSSGTLSSYADNVIDNNPAGNTAPPPILTK